MSTVLTFQLPSGLWGYAVTPGEMNVGTVEFGTGEDALEAAKKVIEREGWSPLLTNSGPMPVRVEPEIASFIGTITIAKGTVTPLRLVKDDE